MSVHSIAKSVTVKTTPQKAFDVFTSKTGLWWGKGETLGKSPHQAIVIEPQVNGRWFERDADGKEIQWGKVLVWDPSNRFTLAWQINTSFKYEPNLKTELEISFSEANDGGTVVKLEHRNLERLGKDSEKFVGMLEAGWQRHVEAFAQFSENKK